MKYFIFVCYILVLINANTVIAQSPQGINYQAIALDGAANPVANQPVGIRFSVLEGSSTGSVVYSETHLPTTDNSGLFSLVIGNGTIVSGSFSSISWHSSSKWLKTEIDIAGGSTYVLMGSSQFMSVPYALFANSSGQSGTFQHPDGLSNITPVFFDTITYTVPAGKNLYANYDYVTVDSLSFVNSIQSPGMNDRPFIGASAGSQVNSSGSGFLVDSTVEWKSININCNPFTVPSGKIFVIITQNATNNSNKAVINGRVNSRNISGQFLKAGDVLSTDLPCSTANRYNVNGYLRSN